MIGFRFRSLIAAFVLVLAMPGAATSEALDRAAAFAMQDAVNFVREYHALEPLALDIDLSRAAQGHAEELARRGELSHRGLDGSRLGNRLRAVDYPYGLAAENLAAGPDLADGAVILWLESPGHRRNLLLDGVTAIGVGFARAPSSNDRFIHYWVLVLAARR